MFKQYFQKCRDVFVANKWLIFGAGVLLGALLILAIRFAIYKPDEVHYHANFAVYINGKRETFKDPQYYQEVEMCTASTAMTPVERAHMHDEVSDVVHVEDHAVTWGQFFNNLGWSLGGDFIATPDQMYVANGQTKLHVIINGQDYTDLTPLTNTVIKDQDKLLVSFGDVSDSVLQQEYKSVPSTAKKYDTTKDPASCSGGHGEASMSARFKHLF